MPKWSIWLVFEASVLGKTSYETILVIFKGCDKEMRIWWSCALSSSGLTWNAGSKESWEIRFCRKVVVEAEWERAELECGWGAWWLNKSATNVTNNLRHTTEKWTYFCFCSILLLPKKERKACQQLFHSIKYLTVCSPTLSSSPFQKGLIRETTCYENTLSS